MEILDSLIINKKRVSNYPMIEMSSAFEIIESEINSIKKIQIIKKTEETEGYITTSEIKSPINIPSLETSMMDGYAIKINNQSDYNQDFEILGKIYAGDLIETTKITDLKNKCYYVTTGSVVPQEFDCVIPIELTNINDDNRFIKIKANESDLKAGKFIRKVGSDISKGETIIGAQEIIKVSDISMLISCGIIEIEVFRKPRIGLLSTGDELANISNFKDNSEVVEFLDKNKNKIIDSNKEMLKLFLKKNSIIVTDLGIIQDKYEKIKTQFESFTNDFDLIITSGGVSMGEKDLIKVFLETEGKVLFGRLNMKPGKPTTFAKYKDCYFFALPGNAVSCFVTYHLLVQYAINLFQKVKANQVMYPKLKAHLISDISCDYERPEYQRAIVYYVLESQKMYVKNTGNQVSSRLKSTQSSNALLLIPKATNEKNKLNEGEEATLYLLDNINVINSTDELNIIANELRQIKNSNHECCENLRHKNINQYHHSNKKFTVGYIVVSDRASQGEYKDESGPEIENFFINLYDHSFEIKEKLIIPDEKEKIEKSLIMMSDNAELSLVLTSGGTGLTQRDVTPEATKNVIDKQAYGIESFLMSESLKITKMACLSRPVVGIRRNTLIVNLPGKPKAVKENLNILLPILKHALNQISSTKDFH